MKLDAFTPRHSWLPGIFLALATVLSVASLAHAEITTKFQYAVTAIGPIPGGTTIAATSVNTSGQVAGVGRVRDEATHAFVTSGDGAAPIDLGTLGGPYSVANGINVAGMVVGQSQTSPAKPILHAFVTRPVLCPGTNCLLDLGTLGGPISSADAVNEVGTIVGSSLTGKYLAHAFSIDAPYTDNSLKDLGTVGGVVSAATAVSATGQIVGASSVGPNPFIVHAMSIVRPYSAGTMRDLGTLGGTSSSASGVNANGQVVGKSAIRGDQAIHAFTVNTDPTGSALSAPTDLGTLGGSYSQANAVNAGGVIVGTSFIGKNAATHAFIYKDDNLVDLNSVLADAPAGLVLTSASAIADNENISATGIWNKRPVAVLLSPRPLHNTFTYVTNQADDTISVFKVSPIDGHLTRLPENTVKLPTGSSPTAIVFSGRFAYVINHGKDSISMFSQNSSTGALSPLSVASVATGPAPDSIVIVTLPSGQYAYVANRIDGSISIYKISTGILQIASSMHIASYIRTSYPIGLAKLNNLTSARMPKGPLLLLVNFFNTVSNYLFASIDPDTGMIGQFLSLYDGQGDNFAITTSGNTAYAVGPSEHLETIQPDNATSIMYPGTGIAVSASGRYVYVIAGQFEGRSDNKLAVFFLSAAGLTPIGDPAGVATGKNPSAVALSSSGTYGYVANQGDGTVSVYKIDQATGIPAPTGIPVTSGSSVNSGPSAIAIR